MECVVGAKHSFQLSQFYKHAGRRNEKITPGENEGG